MHTEDLKVPLWLMVEMTSYTEDHIPNEIKAMEVLIVREQAREKMIAIDPMTADAQDLREIGNTISTSQDRLLWYRCGLVIRANDRLMTIMQEFSRLYGSAEHRYSPSRIEEVLNIDPPGKEVPNDLFDLYVSWHNSREILTPVMRAVLGSVPA